MIIRLYHPDNSLQIPVWQANVLLLRTARSGAQPPDAGARAKSGAGCVDRYPLQHICLDPVSIGMKRICKPPYP